MNWPDLRRDYDNFTCCCCCCNLCRSELTWFEKGLRPYVSSMYTHQVRTRVNWPDLRRDYDLGKKYGLDQRITLWVNWPDLRRDYDPLLFTDSSASFSSSELTWFEKGLRHASLNSFKSFVSMSELTWFEKGLRHFIGFRSLKMVIRVNWPDLRRDYD